MAKYIEMIERYRIEQEIDTDYNPPSFLWVDNLGELVRCKDCKHSGYRYRDFHGTEKVVCWKDGYGIRKNANGYCDDGDFRDEKDGEQDG